MFVNETNIRYMFHSIFHVIDLATRFLVKSSVSCLSIRLSGLALEDLLESDLHLPISLLAD